MRKSAPVFSAPVTPVTQTGPTKKNNLYIYLLAPPQVKIAHSCFAQLPNSSTHQCLLLMLLRGAPHHYAFHQADPLDSKNLPNCQNLPPRRAPRPICPFQPPMGAPVPICPNLPQGAPPSIYRASQKEVGQRLPSNIGLLMRKL